MRQEEKLKEEAEFWITYINNWIASHDEPVPEKAWTLLDKALLRLKHYYLGKIRVKPSQIESRSMH